MLPENVFAEATERWLAHIQKGPQTGFLRSWNPEKGLTATGSWEWTSGFASGILWQLNGHSENEAIKAEAIRQMEILKIQADFGKSHDLGFLFMPTYGRAFAQTRDTAYRSMLIKAANRLAGRFNPKIGLIQSWEADKKYQYPVVIDGLMNLELLCKATELSGDSSFIKLAQRHADSTLKYHIREDGSHFHVVDFDTAKGGMRRKDTEQGYATGTTWSRGQAWVVYGYTTLYRYTGVPGYLASAANAADFYLNHPDLPEDLVPYWDFMAPGIPEAKRDVSAAAIFASGLLKLSAVIKDERAQKYREAAGKLITSLCSEDYFIQDAKKYPFLLDHGVGAFHERNEIDQPLIYADYYFLEAVTTFLEISPPSKVTEG